jgi:hypothetical protein
VSTDLLSVATSAAVLCVRVTSLISPVVLVVTRKLWNQADMTQKRRVWLELTRAIGLMAPMQPGSATSVSSEPPLSV